MKTNITNSEAVYNGIDEEELENFKHNFFSMMIEQIIPK